MDLLRLLENSDNPLESARKLLAPACMNKLNQYIIDCNDCSICCPDILCCLFNL